MCRKTFKPSFSQKMILLRMNEIVWQKLFGVQIFIWRKHIFWRINNYFAYKYLFGVSIFIWRTNNYLA